LVGAGAVVHRGKEVLLVKRNFPPNQGKWSIPGGRVELGEEVDDAAVREIREETGLSVEIEGLLDVQTLIQKDRKGAIKYHYILVDYIARAVGGRLRLDPESSSCGWFTESESRRLDTTSGTATVLRRYFRQRPR
jgi:ADP-ribose pyrophosphatase YjhB (NUDIX family)